MYYFSIRKPILGREQYHKMSKDGLALHMAGLQQQRTCEQRRNPHSANRAGGCALVLHFWVISQCAKYFFECHQPSHAGLNGVAQFPRLRSMRQPYGQKLISFSHHDRERPSHQRDAISFLGIALFLNVDTILLSCMPEVLGGMRSSMYVLILT